MFIFLRFCLAVTLATTLIVSVPAHADSYRLISSPEMVAGSRALESGDYEQAIEALEASLTDRRGDPFSLILTNLCVAYTAMQAYDKALPECEKAVAESCHSSEAHYFNNSLLDAISHNNRGVLRARLGDYAGALADFELASRPIIDRQDVRRKITPYGNEIRTNVRLAINSELEEKPANTVEIADID